MGKLEGKVAVITGGNSGIGLAFAEKFVAEGAYVFITDRQAEQDKAVERIGRNVTGVRADVADRADLDRLYATGKQQKGKIDVLCANAGVGWPAPIGSITAERFDTICGINVRGLLFSVQKALPRFRDGGSIILMAPQRRGQGRPSSWSSTPTMRSRPGSAASSHGRAQARPDPRQVGRRDERFKAPIVQGCTATGMSKTCPINALHCCARAIRN
jgi:NAD(P)-dependent dehydrogenase (short-subunit alcohol dehydrogenase family)